MPGARAIGREARWQVSTLLLLLGPALGAAGWAASFTTIGAQLIFAGIAASVVGWFVRPTGWTLAFAAGGLFVCFGWFVLLWGVYLGWHALTEVLP
ncbi:MAG: hypothetical protein R3C39_08780 [Dehalococcoidia bacterium]